MTYVLNGLEEIEDLLGTIAEDFRDIDFVEFMGGELDRLSDWEAELFANQKAPDGTAWPANAPSTIRAKGHSKILRGHPSNNFRLSRSLTEKGRASEGDKVREAIQSDTGAYLSHGSLVEYGPLHDKARGNIPARPHVGVDNDYVDRFARRVVDHAVEQLKGL